MKGRILNIVLVLVMATLPMAANAGWSEAQQVADQTLPAPSKMEETPAPDADFQSSPVMFIENDGQWDDGARFQVWGGPAGTMWLAEDAIWITVLEPGQEETSRLGTIPEGQIDTDPRLSPSDRVDPSPGRGVNIKLSFVGANLLPRIETFDRLDTIVSYFHGNDPDQWRPDVPVWGGVRYEDLYPGIDLEVTNEDGRMVQRLAVRPSADLAAVQLRVEGADAVAVDGDRLRLSTAVGNVVLPLLLAVGSNGGATVQARSGRTFDVSTPFAALSPTPHSPLATPNSPTDNPADLLYGTFLGGSGSDYAYGTAVDATGSAYVTGYTLSRDFPTTPGAFDPGYNGGNLDTFIVKLNPTGSALAYATFLGGNDDDYSNDIAVDSAGSAYVIGDTRSSDFPTTPGAFDTTYNYIDAFVAKLNPAGSGLAYATFLGGATSGEEGVAIALDGSHNVYVTGGTYSSDFPTTPGAFDTSHNGGLDGFVVKLNPAGSSLAYATFLGGSSGDEGVAITVDGARSAYVTGGTRSSNFPTTPGAFDMSYNGGLDGFVVKLNPVGSSLAYATFLGGSSGGHIFDIVVDGLGSAYMTGYTASSDFPTTPGVLDPSYNGSEDAFVVKLNPAGSGLAYATFLGGSDRDGAYAISVDGAGSTTVTGYTASSDFPTTPGVFDPSFNGVLDAFVVKLNPAGSGLAYATFLGSSGSDVGRDITLDGASSAYVTGWTLSLDFPTTPGAFDPSYNGGNSDAFVAKLAMRIVPGAYTISGRVTTAEGASISNVTMTDGSGHSVVTDANGSYSFTGLFEGSYTVTPSRSGFIFCPGYRIAAVPPNQTNRNFTGSPAGTDLGFCPEPDGFGFANQQLWRTWPMFERFYSPDQVRKPDGSICGEAQRYFDLTYRGVANGWSCVGFTLSSLHSYQNRPQPNAGPFAISHYERLYDQTESIQLTNPIAYYSGVQLSQQYLNEYQAWLATCGTDPNQIVTRLQQALQAGNPLLLGLNAGSVYHAITPYRVVTVSSTETHIYVYDNEAPGQQRVVRMQRSGSGWQWQYTFTGSLASAGTRTGGCRDMYYYQAITSLEHGAPLVNLCEDTGVAVSDGAPAPASTGRMLTVLPATGDWIIEDTTGNRLGWAGVLWIAEIPNGYALPQALGDATLSYRSLYLPAGPYTVQASSGSSRQVDYSLFADGRVLEVSGQTPVAGTISEIDVLPGLDAISVTRPADLASLVIDMTHEMPTMSRTAGLTGSAISGTDDLAISFDGQEVQLSRASGEMQYRLRFFQPGSSSGYFVTEPITLGADEAHTLAPANWIGLTASTVTLEIDEGRNGTIDETVTLENTARSIYLPVVPGS